MRMVVVVVEVVEVVVVVVVEELPDTIIMTKPQQSEAS